MNSPKKVFVSGCFDLLHSGHVEFLNEAAQLGNQLFVCIGSDATVAELKGRWPICSQNERKFMLENLRAVHQVLIGSANGMIDFLPELLVVRPDLFVVNEDGHTPSKAKLCDELGIEYLILKRQPHADLPPRSTTDLRQISNIPFRIDFCGGWLDQPMVNRLCAGAVITASLEPTIEFNDRSGMASSTRKTAIRLWKTALPTTDSVELARVLFAADNPPGTREIAGSQDAIGICCPDLNRIDYANGDYWPVKITNENEENTIQFLEKHIFLVNLGPRENDYSVLENTDVTFEKAQRLAAAADLFWNACLEKNLQKLARAMTDGAEAQWAMFPNMVFDGLRSLIETFKNRGALGWKLSGAGGGGYLILVLAEPLPEAIPIKIRRRSLSF